MPQGSTRMPSGRPAAASRLGREGVVTPGLGTATTWRVSPVKRPQEAHGILVGDHADDDDPATRYCSLRSPSAAAMTRLPSASWLLSSQSSAACGALSDERRRRARRGSVRRSASHDAGLVDACGSLIFKKLMRAQRGDWSPALSNWCGRRVRARADRSGRRRPERQALRARHATCQVCPGAKSGARMCRLAPRS